MLRMIIIAAAMLASAGAAQAQADYPNRAVRIVVPSAPGGGTDITARLLAQELSKTMGQSFVIENRPGAGQMIGISWVTQSDGDGYTLLMTASTLAINPAMYKKVSYDVFRDFAPITQVVALPNILVVNAALAAHSVREFIAMAKQRPGQLTYASAGIGTSPHMSMELFKSMAGVDILHVPYKGTTPGLTDLLSGTINAMMINVLTAMPHIRSGKLRALGVTGLKRLPDLPDVPTIAEAGVPGYEAINWYGLLAPAKTPIPIIQRLHAEVVKALDVPEVRAHIAADGAEPVGNTPDEFTQRIRTDMDKWAATARAAGITPR
jgi:tripartite-type tricarboxylate transporter receptor subunit TctC